MLAHTHVAAHWPATGCNTSVGPLHVSPSHSAATSGRAHISLTAAPLGSRYFRDLGHNYTTIPEFFRLQGYETVGGGKIFRTCRLLTAICHSTLTLSAHWVVLQIRATRLESIRQQRAQLRREHARQTTAARAVTTSSLAGRIHTSIALTVRTRGRPQTIRLACPGSPCLLQRKQRTPLATRKLPTTQSRCWTSFVHAISAHLSSWHAASVRAALPLVSHCYTNAVCTLQIAHIFRLSLQPQSSICTQRLR